MRMLWIRSVSAAIPLAVMACAGGPATEPDIVQLKRVAMPGRSTETTYQIVLGAQRVAEIERQTRSQMGRIKSSDFFVVRDELIRTYLQSELGIRGICKGVELARESRRYDRSHNIEVIAACH